MRRTPALRGTALALAAVAVGGAGEARGQCEATETQTLTAAGTAAFGHSVAVDGTTILVGAPEDDAGGGNAGAAFVFVHDGGTWVQQQKLLALGGAGGDALGTTVALSGPAALAGAPFADDAGVNAGAAYVFRFDGSIWTQEAELFPIDGQGGLDEFGSSVAVRGDVAVVGAIESFGPGAAYVFRHDGAAWAHEQTLVASDGQSDDRFGRSVALGDGILLVGAHRDDDGGTDAGAVYVFGFREGAWSEQEKLTASDAAPGDGFGVSVGLSGDAAIVGANNDTGGPVSGSAYVFRFDGATWLEEAKLPAPAAAAPDSEFGHAVAVDGNTALVGAWLDDGAAADSGAAYVYGFDGATWALRAKLTASDGAFDDNFGESVALLADTGVIGASDGNAAYVVDNLPDPCAACPWDLDGSGAVGVSDFLELLASWGPCPADCPADFDADGSVGVGDFLELLGNWGPCGGSGG